MRAKNLHQDNLTLGGNKVDNPKFGFFRQNSFKLTFHAGNIRVPGEVVSLQLLMQRFPHKLLKHSNLPSSQNIAL